MKGTAWFVEHIPGVPPPTPAASLESGVQGEEKPRIPAPPGAPAWASGSHLLSHQVPVGAGT